MDIKRAIDNLRSRYKDIEKYVEIMKTIRTADISTDERLQRIFNAFYRVRRNAVWRKEFYDLFEECKEKNDLSFECILRDLFKRTGRIEASFSSKMLATLNPEMPIWDSIVLSKLGYKPGTGKDKEKRIAEAVEIYNEIVCWYERFLKTDASKEFLKEFDKAFPEFQELTDIKKIDFILWGGGDDNPLETKYIELKGCVEIPAAISVDEFANKFMAFIEENRWYYGGNINECREEMSSDCN